GRAWQLVDDWTFLRTSVVLVPAQPGSPSQRMKRKPPMPGATSVTSEPASTLQLPALHVTPGLDAVTVPTAPTTVPDTDTPRMYPAVQVMSAVVGRRVMPCPATVPASQPAPAQPETR